MLTSTGTGKYTKSGYLRSLKFAQRRLEWSVHSRPKAKYVAIYNHVALYMEGVQKYLIREFIQLDIPSVMFRAVNVLDRLDTKLGTKERFSCLTK